MPDPSAPITLTVAGLPAPQRLDAWLRRAQPGWGRQQVQRLIGERRVHINGRLVWLSSWQVHNGDEVTIAQPPPARVEPGGPSRLDEAWLLHVDDHLIAVNKPAGLLSEAPPFRPDAPNLHSLAQARFGLLTLFHRLDRDTSGLLLLTRTPAANRRLAAAFQGHLLEKEYRAVVRHPNRLAAAGVIALRLGPDPAHRDRRTVVAKGGQFARTHYRVAATRPASELDPGRQWVHLYPATGRTHQLRVHLAAFDAPILGDRLYGDPAAAPRLLLHALRIALPAWEDQPALDLVAPLPDEFDWPATAASGAPA